MQSRTQHGQCASSRGITHIFVAAQMKLQLVAMEVAPNPSQVEVEKSFSAMARTLVEHAKRFPRWMDGTCVPVRLSLGPCSSGMIFRCCMKVEGQYAMLELEAHEKNRGAALHVARASVAVTVSQLGCAMWDGMLLPASQLYSCTTCHACMHCNSTETPF